MIKQTILNRGSGLYRVKYARISGIDPNSHPSYSCFQ